MKFIVLKWKLDFKHFHLVLLKISKYLFYVGVHNGAMVTHSLPNSEVCGSNSESFVGKLVSPYRWSVVYSTELCPILCAGVLCSQNYPPRYDLFSVESNVKTQRNKIFYVSWQIN